jgi:hypothetical protein
MKKMMITMLAGCMVLVSCKTPEPALKGDWNAPVKMDVKGRNGWAFNEQLSFGSYRTVTVKRSWTKGSGAFAGWAMYKPGYNEIEKIIGVDYSQRKQKLRFEMTDALQQQSAVFCMTEVRSANFIIGNNPNSVVNTVSSLLEIGDNYTNGYWVNIYLKNSDRPWEMVIDNNGAQRDRRNYTGFLALDSRTYYVIKPIYSLQNKKGEAVNIIGGSFGFEFQDRNGRPLAAVSMMDNGRVYFNDDVTAEERFLLANACAALLMQQQI